MIGKMLNLPFKVLGSVARAVQEREAKQWKDLEQEDASAAAREAAIDLEVPEDFDPGVIHMDGATAVATADAVVVDVREPSDFAAGHAAGAMHLPLASLGIRLSELPPNTPIIIIAGSDAMGTRAVRFLRHRGLDDTWTLSGGLETWRSADGTIEKG